jgi:S-layer homology domain
MLRHLRLMIIGSMLLTTGTVFAEDSAFSQKPFTDVPNGSTYYEAIEYLRTQNVLKGYLDGTFKPETRINRAEFVMFVANPFILDTNDMGDCLKTHVPEGTQNVFFSDVDRDEWYALQVCFAKVRNLVDGYPDGTFKPSASINFVEAAKILSNVFALEVSGNTGEFWYRPYVEHMSEINAIPTSIKRFDQTITRGEMAEMVYRMKAVRQDKASANYSDLR